MNSSPTFRLMRPAAKFGSPPTQAPSFGFSRPQLESFGDLRIGAESSITVNGDFTNTGRVATELSGRPSDLLSGQVVVDGSASLSGTVEVTLAAGFPAVEGDTYSVVTFADQDEAQFTTLDLPFNYDSGYSPTQFVVSVGDLQTADLVATQITGPDTALSGQVVTLSWTITNEGNIDAVGPWHDELRVTRRSQFPLADGFGLFDDEQVFAEDSVAIGQFQVGEGLTLAPGQSITFQRDVRIPGRELGEYYFQVATNARAEVLEITNLPSNNVVSTETPFQLTVPTLVVDGDSVVENFEPSAREFWFQVEVPASQDVLIELDATSDAVVTEIFAGDDYLPTRFQFTDRQDEVGAADTTLVLPSEAVPKTWFVLARINSTISSAEGFSIMARSAPAAIDAVSPNLIGAATSSTLRISGSQLHSGLTYRLVGDDPVNMAEATTVFRSGGDEAFASFDTLSLPGGAYGVEVLDGDAVVASLADAVTVAGAELGEIKVTLSLPSIVRAGRSSTLVVHFENTGNTDLRLPFTTVTAEQGDLRVRRDGTYLADSLTFIPPSVTPGLTVLPAGQTTSMSLFFNSPNHH